MPAQTYTPNLGLANNYQASPSTDTPILAADLNKENTLLDEIVFRPYQQSGPGVAQGRLNQFAVSAGSGLSVVVASGVGVVGTDALFVPVKLTSPTTLSGLEANRSSSNPLYLFLIADDGTGPNPPSTISQIPLFRISDFSTLTGGLLLATIVTGASTVTSVTPNLSRFASVADGSGQLTKSVAGNTDVTLTTAEAANLNLEFSGALTANINIIVPTTRRMWRVYNRTSGAFTLTVKTAGGTGVVVVQGGQALLESNGTSVVSAFQSDASGAVTRRYVTADTTITAQQAQVTCFKTSGNVTITLPTIAQMYATGFDYAFLLKTNGGTATLTINTNAADGNIIYNVGAESNSYVANTDSVWTILRPYPRSSDPANPNPGLSILDS